MRQKKMLITALLLFMTVLHYGCTTGGDKAGSVQQPGLAQTAQTCPVDVEEYNAILPDDVAKGRETAFTTSQIFADMSSETQNKQVAKEGPFSLDDLFAVIESDVTKVSTGMKIYFGAFTSTNCDNSDLGYISTPNALVPIFVLTRKDNKSWQKDFGSYYIFDPKGKKLQVLQTATAKAWVTNYRDILKKNGHLDIETHTLVFERRPLENMMCNLRSQRAAKPDKEISFFNINWGAYEKDIVLYNGTVKPVMGRLTMMINVPNADKKLLANLHYHFFADSATDMRKKAWHDRIGNGRKDDEAYFDTAVPCPPGMNCDAGDDLIYK